AAVIWLLGSGRFGREGTQRLIDRFRAVPAVHRFLNRHHGTLRASGHYVQFGGLFVVLYWLADSAAGEGRFSFRWLIAVPCAFVSFAAAYLDELHQLRSGKRMF